MASHWNITKNNIGRSFSMLVFHDILQVIKFIFKIKLNLIRTCIQILNLRDLEYVQEVLDGKARGVYQSGSQ